jgi:septum site-determining protein MinC
MDVHDPPARASLPSLLRHDGGVPVLVLPDDLPFEELRGWLRDRVAAAQDEIGGRACRMDLGGRELLLFDLRRLIHLLRDTFSVDITGLYVRPEAIHRYAERELKLKLFPNRAGSTTPAPEAAKADPTPADGPAEGEALPGMDDLTALLQAVPADEVVAEADAATDEDPIPAVFEPGEALRRVPSPDLPREEPELDAEGGRRTLTVRRTLRSGAAIRYDGDVVVLGDVNAGAQIRAGGHVIVLGRLRGVVHAGANGQEDAFILAFELAPTQLRIGRHIAIAPARAAVGDAFVPEIAAVEGESIVIEPWKGRLRRS